MSLKIKLNNISVPSGNQFKVFYRLDSRTPGSVASQGEVTWGTLYGTYTGGTTTNIEIDFLPIISNPYGKQHWFKILDTVTGSYIIENIYIHEYEYYTACLSTPTPTPTPTSTPTPTATNTPLPTSTPTPTATPEPTATPTATEVPESTNTPTPTATNTPLPTSTPTPTATEVPESTNTPTPTATPIVYPGDCYEMVFPSSSTSLNGQTLYICYVKTDDTSVCWPYSQFEDSGENTPNITVNICSKFFPSIKYGQAGEQLVPDASFSVTTGGGCTTSVDCGGNDPVPPPPTPTPTSIPDDSGLCYTYTLTTGEAQLYSGLTVTYTPLGTTTPINVSVTNGVESRDNLDGTYTYYICSKTTPQIYDGQTGVIAFAIDQNGACDYENNCQNPIVTNTPTPTNTTTPTPTPTPLPPGTQCIIWTESTEYGLSDGCGGNQRETTTLTATLQDGNGNNVNASETIYVAFDATYSNELGTTATNITAVINVGYSSGVTTYAPLTYEIGPYSSQCTQETTTRDNDTPTITGSNGGTYSVCPT